MLLNKGKVYQKYKKSLVSTRRYVDVKEKITFVSQSCWSSDWNPGQQIFVFISCDEFEGRGTEVDPLVDLDFNLGFTDKHIEGAMVVRMWRCATYILQQACETGRRWHNCKIQCKGASAAVTTAMCICVNRTTLHQPDQLRDWNVVTFSAKIHGYFAEAFFIQNCQWNIISGQKFDWPGSSWPFGRVADHTLSRVTVKRAELVLFQQTMH